jgi:membrane protease YdiL (CAAX protease family)
VRARVLALVRWLLGDIPERAREPDSGTLVVWVSFAAALGMWLGLRHQPKGDPVLVGTWRMLAHGGIPLVAVAAWELRDAWRRGQPPGSVAFGVTFGGAALLLGPVIARFTDAGLASMATASFLRMSLPGLVGAAAILLGLRLAQRDLKVWGIGLGDWRWWLPHHGVLLAALVPVLMATTWLVKPLADYYPVNKAARTSLEAFGTAHLGIALDFIGWEFLFRGFLLFAFARRGDPLMAILAHAFPFYLLHANKPHVELLSSFVGGIFAGWFCLRAGTFLPLWVIHLTMMTVVGFTSFMMRNWM